MIGSGVTGAEFASAYNALGADVVLVSSRDRVLPGRGRRGRRGARGRAQAARDDGAEPGRAPSRWSRDGDGVSVTLTDGRDGRGLALSARRRLDPEHRRPRPRVGRRRARRRAASSPSTGSRARPARGVYAAGDCTGVLMLASVAAMQGRIAMWHALGDAVTPLNLKPSRPTSSRPRRSPPSAGASRRSTPARSTRLGVMLPLAGNAARQDAGRARRVRQALLPARHRHRGRRRRGRAAGQRADPRGVAGRRGRG